MTAQLIEAMESLASEEVKEITFYGVEQTAIGPIGICSIENNPWVSFNQCTCYTNMEIKGHHRGCVIVFDKQYWDILTPEQRLWVINHECGHLYYRDYILDQTTLTHKQICNIEVRADKFAYLNSQLSGREMYQLLKMTFDRVSMEGLSKEHAATLQNVYFVRLCSAVGICIGESIANVCSGIKRAAKHIIWYVKQYGFKALIKGIIKERIEEVNIRSNFK